MQQHPKSPCKGKNSVIKNGNPEDTKDRNNEGTEEGQAEPVNLLTRKQNQDWESAQEKHSCVFKRDKTKRARPKGRKKTLDRLKPGEQYKAGHAGGLFTINADHAPQRHRRF